MNRSEGGIAFQEWPSDSTRVCITVDKFKAELSGASANTRDG
jgi:hypothetical protein